MTPLKRALLWAFITAATWGPGCVELANANATATQTIGVARLKSNEELGITCKTITDSACPYCSHQRCHDKTHQWDEPLYTCPAIACQDEHTEPFKPAEWK